MQYLLIREAKHSIEAALGGALESPDAGVYGGNGLAREHPT
jgi:hypothetical protein